MDFQKRIKNYIDEDYQQVVKEEERRLIQRYKGSHFFEENIREMIKKEEFVTIRITEELKKRLERASRITNQDRSKLIRKSIIGLLDYLDRKNRNNENIEI